MCIWIMPSSIHADGEQWSFPCSSSVPGKARRSANIETRDGCLIGLACHPNVDLHSVLGCLGLQGENNEPTDSLGMGGSSSPVVLYSARSWCLVWANLTGDRTACQCTA